MTIGDCCFRILTWAPQMSSTVPYLIYLATILLLYSYTTVYLVLIPILSPLVDQVWTYIACVAYGIVVAMLVVSFLLSAYSNPGYAFAKGRTPSKMELVVSKPVVNPHLSSSSSSSSSPSASPRRPRPRFDPTLPPSTPVTKRVAITKMSPMIEGNQASAPPSPTTGSLRAGRRRGSRLNIKARMSQMVAHGDPEDEVYNMVFPDEFSEDESTVKMAETEYNSAYYCKTCQQLKPPRCHHCRICNKCVLRMDHHCKWINNCVGYHNQKYFMLLLFYGWMGANVVAGGCVSRWVLYSRMDSLNYLDAAILVLTTVLSMLHFLTFNWMLAFNGFLMVRNITNIEWSCCRGVSAGCRWDKGSSYENVATVMGRSVLCWLLPVSACTDQSQEEFLPGALHDESDITDNEIDGDSTSTDSVGTATERRNNLTSDDEDEGFRLSNSDLVVESDDERSFRRDSSTTGKAVFFARSFGDDDGYLYSEEEEEEGEFSDGVGSAYDEENPQPSDRKSRYDRSRHYY
eukprot:TRINITY_DN3958_c0_g1_i1.p1 TRINITY_DN3958_c0_g1~~TRINITY_DN3958_c0_g1_i1.p1  ORF type:complete len:538 (-),score=91.39 TRINITY_DN3958_c0_g1_i1:11-1558(-)